ncbi:MAG TPA: hypothetical protein VK689_11545 [Armatimonadota bacterium]|nr:hypothetical protein [Armatimonadota bacterium]
MSDPFNILGPEPDAAPTFEQAMRDAVTRLQSSYARFEALYDQVPEEQFTDQEWRVVEMAADEVAEAVERAEDGYVAVQYDSHAWYRIIETLETVRLRLESAIGMMERVRERIA